MESVRDRVAFITGAASGIGALAIDGGGGNFHRKSSREPGRPHGVERLLSDLGDAASHDLADLPRVDPGPVDCRLLDVPQQVGRVDSRERSTAPSDRCTYGLDDVHWLHGLPP